MAMALGRTILKLLHGVIGRVLYAEESRGAKKAACHSGGMLTAQVTARQSMTGEIC